MRRCPQFTVMKFDSPAVSRNVIVFPDTDTVPAWASDGTTNSPAIAERTATTGRARAGS